MYGCCSEEAIIQNLKDAGCSQAMIERFMANLDEEHKSESPKDSCGAPPRAIRAAP